jgi:hypothetical protein
VGRGLQAISPERSVDRKIPSKTAHVVVVEGRGGRLRVIAVAQHRARLPYAPEALGRASLVGRKSQRVETVFGQASAAQSSLLASATCSGGAAPAGRQRPVGRFERSHVGAQALESLRGDAHLQLIVARVQG